MIPKKIHYCWFGGNPLPELAQKCIESWQKFCPDYEIIEWNESNFDIEAYPYAKEAYDAKKWAFVSDVARLHALVTQGGIYMDTDVEVLRPLDDLLEYEAFSGFESYECIQTGIMASTQNQALFKEFLNEYDNIHFLKPDGSFDTTTNVKRITDRCLKYGIELNNTKQTIKGFTLFPSDYFCPKSLQNRKITLTDNTYVIHHFDGSWQEDNERYMAAWLEKYGKFFPARLSAYIAKFISIYKYDGIKPAFTELLLFVKKSIKRIGR